MNIITIISFILTVASLFFAFITWQRTESAKHRLKIEINRIVDDSHKFRWEVMTLLKNSDPKALSIFQSRIDNFNHEIFIALLSLDKKLANGWIKRNKKDENGFIDWDYYELLFQWKFKHN